MKRLFRDGEEGEMESINVANVLVLLSSGGGEGIIDVSKRSSTSPERVFECKTCNRQFPSFQALGGHRASHKKPRLTTGDGHAELAKPRVHECSICGLGFAIGQALGGHMRRHRTSAAAVGLNHVAVEKKPDDDEKKAGLWLDLNVLPAVADGEVDRRRKKIFGFELIDIAAPPMAVDCFH